MARAKWVCCFFFLLMGCSDGGAPPVLGDPMTMPTAPDSTDGGTGVTCGSPAKGCPCSNQGEQVYCGNVYRISGNHVDCSKGYLTCQTDGGWSGCEGATIFEGD